MSERSAQQRRMLPAGTVICLGGGRAAEQSQELNQRPRGATGERALALSTLEPTMPRASSSAQDFSRVELTGIAELELAAALSDVVLRTAGPFHVSPAAIGVAAEERDEQFVNRAALRYTELLGLVANEWAIPPSATSSPIVDRETQPGRPPKEQRSDDRARRGEDSDETTAQSDWASVRNGLAFDLGRAVDLRWRAHLLSEAARDTPETTDAEAAAHSVVRELMPKIANAILELHELLCRRAERFPLPEREEVRQEIHGEWMRWDDIVQEPAPGVMPVSDEMRERLTRERDGMGSPPRLDVSRTSVAPGSPE